MRELERERETMRELEKERDYERVRERKREIEEQGLKLQKTVTFFIIVSSFYGS